MLEKSGDEKSGNEKSGVEKSGVKKSGVEELTIEKYGVEMGVKSSVLKCPSTCQTCHKFPFHRFLCRENSMEYICKCHKHFVTYIQIGIQPEGRSIYCQI